MRLISAIQQRIGQRLAKALSPYFGPTVDQLAGVPAELGAGEVGLLDADLISTLTRPWRMSRNRQERHAIRQRMADESALIGKALDVIADVATAPEDEGDARNAFLVRCEEDRITEEVELLCDAIKLRESSNGIARRLATHGNEMREPVLDPAGGRVVRYKLLPEHQIWRRLDDRGLPQDPPWEQRPYYKQDGSGIPFAEWQVVQYTYPIDPDEAYGRGILGCEREYMRLAAMEDDMVQARRQRAMDRMVHRVPVTEKMGRDDQEAAVKRYADKLMRRRVLSATQGTSTRDNPTEVTQDFYVPYVGKDYPDAGPKLLTPANVQLQVIRDVEYHRGIVLARLGVPMRYLNLGGAEAARAAIGSGNISYEDIQFARTIRGMQKSLAYGHNIVITLHLILRGYDPIKNPVALEFPVISTADAKQNAEIEYMRAQTLQIIANFLQVPLEMVADHYMGLTEDEKERWLGDLGEQWAGAAEEQLGRRAQSLQGILEAVLVLANKELEGDGGNAEAREPAPSGAGSYNYPGPA